MLGLLHVLTTSLFVLTTSHFIVLSGPDNLAVEINIEQIVLLRPPRDPDRIVHKDAKCIVFLSDGKFIAVSEECAMVRALIDDAVHSE